MAELLIEGETVMATLFFIRRNMKIKNNNAQADTARRQKSCFISCHKSTRRQQSIDRTRKSTVRGTASEPAPELYIYYRG